MTIHQQISQPGGAYNVVPYESLPFAQSQPAKLAALATLFGLSPPKVPTARVLELGCAAGGNIVPLAARFPEASFLGIDLSVRHVEDGRSRIAALGLDNIEIRQGDLTELSLEPESFDYVICHGVYSWVPPAARDAILRIASHALSRNGIAYISYNVFPGWQMRNVVRDMMIYHAGMDGEPQARIAKARWVLDQIARDARGGSAYGELLRSEAAMLARQRDSYILGEFLAHDNAPCYFRDFIADAEQHGLAYLCESELQLCLPENLSPEIGQLIRIMSMNKLVPLEQYIDFFIGRSFRQTLIVKAGAAAGIERNLVPERLRSLHLSASLSVSAADSTRDRFVLRNRAGGTLTTGILQVRKALELLGAAYPETRTLAELTAGLAAAGDPIGTGTETLVLDSAFKMVMAGVGYVTSEPVRCATTDGHNPIAWPLARADAQSGSGWTTNLRHETVVLDVVRTALLPHMDGTHDHEALASILIKAVHDGRIQLQDSKTGLLLSGTALEQAAVEHVDLAITRAATDALLIPDPAQG